MRSDFFVVGLPHRFSLSSFTIFGCSNQSEFVALFV